MKHVQIINHTIVLPFMKGLIIIPFTNERHFISISIFNQLLVSKSKDASVRERVDSNNFQVSKYNIEYRIVLYIRVYILHNLSYVNMFLQLDFNTWSTTFSLPLVYSVSFTYFFLKKCYFNIFYKSGSGLFKISIFGVTDLRK